MARASPVTTGHPHLVSFMSSTKSPATLSIPVLPPVSNQQFAEPRPEHLVCTNLQELFVMERLIVFPRSVHLYLITSAITVTPKLLGRSQRIPP